MQHWQGVFAALVTLCPLWNIAKVVFDGQIWSQISSAFFFLFLWPCGKDDPESWEIYYGGTGTGVERQSHRIPSSQKHQRSGGIAL